MTPVTERAPAAGPSPAQRLTFVTMTATVVGSMVGDGVFSLPRWFAEEAGILGAMIAWLVAGSGMLMMAFVFQMLAMRNPELDASGLRRGELRRVPRLVLHLRLPARRVWGQRDLRASSSLAGSPSRRNQ